MTAVTDLQNHLDRMKKAGLCDMKFATGEISEVTPEAFCEEANIMLTAIEAGGKATPLSFNDSQFL